MIGGARPVSSYGETRVQGTQPSRVDHPVDSGPPAVVTPAIPQVAPPTGVVGIATPLFMTAQVRDGVAVFGPAGTQVVTFPTIGANAPSSLAQNSVTKELSAHGASSQALDLSHLVSG